MNWGVLIFPNVEELDFAGPWEILGMWSKFSGGPDKRLIVAEAYEPVTCAKGLIVVPHVSFAQCPPLDYLLVPGGEGTRREVYNPALIDFIAGQAKSCRAVLSVCTGSFLLHRAGLLNGRKATTHWGSLERLRKLGDVHVEEERFTRDGNVWTAAGVSAGIDMMLAFIAETAGERAAGIAQFAAEYYPSSRAYGDFHTGPDAPAYLKK
ncbi:MAG: DJ-1/PfpI family protein [Deltaproteobacteria bacterium HGW-Deltaproteobacteria-19]|jgi:transcriptional regulator GlxA family with amidase domain|nr:MAG: DJ-1/PfpI family protein [Deltaproteobacteria bacterium HGW-Deltaproteobacteria-19]